jgi:hypothetical protein
MTTGWSRPAWMASTWETSESSETLTCCFVLADSSISTIDLSGLTLMRSALIAGVSLLPTDGSWISPGATSGAVTMKMTSSTSITSMYGTTLIWLIGLRVRRIAGQSGGWKALGIVFIPRRRPAAAGCWRTPR